MPPMAATISDLNLKHKYFILHDNSQAFAMNNISVSPDGKTMLCTLESIPAEHQLHLTDGSKSKMTYSNSNDRDESAVLNEVHIYTLTGLNTVAGSYTVGLDKIQKIEVLEKDKEKTKKSKRRGTITTVGISVLAAGVIALALIGSSLKSLGN